MITVRREVWPDSQEALQARVDAFKAELVAHAKTEGVPAPLEEPFIMELAKSGEEFRVQPKLAVLNDDGVLIGITYSPESAGDRAVKEVPDDFVALPGTVKLNGDVLEEFTPPKPVVLSMVDQIIAAGPVELQKLKDALNTLK